MKYLSLYWESGSDRTDIENVFGEGTLTPGYVNAGAQWKKKTETITRYDNILMVGL